MPLPLRSGASDVDVDDRPRGDARILEFGMVEGRLLVVAIVAYTIWPVPPIYTIAECLFLIYVHIHTSVAGSYAADRVGECACVSDGPRMRIPYESATAAKWEFLNILNSNWP